MLRIAIGAPVVRRCDGLSRRDFVTAGSLALGGLTLAELGQAQAASEKKRTDTAVILLWMDGGPSHLDTFDMKPDAPAEYRGPFKTIRSNVPGIDVCEHLPLQAKSMDKVALVRSLCHHAGAHEEGAHWVLTGHFAFQPSRLDPKNPAAGAVAAKLRGANRRGLPPYVAVPAARSAGNSPGYHSAAYLGSAFNPFQTGGDPNAEEFTVRDLRVAGGLSLDHLGDRRQMVHRFDDLRRDFDRRGVAHSLDKFQHEAFEVVTSQAARTAFEIGRENPRLRDRYGRHTWGQSALLARRLVEAGVTYVTCHLGGWDHHSRIVPRLQDDYLPRFDQTISALVEDLAQRGLQKRVLVCALGEFGRTPLINKDAGRDHWPEAGWALFAGGGLKTGMTVGATTARGEFVRERPLAPDDLLATVYRVLGINPRQNFVDSTGRPNPILGGGEPIRELVD